MRTIWVVIAALAFVLGLTPCASAKLAGDMEDGIGMDDGFDHGSELKKLTNANYKRVKAQAAAERAKQDAKDGVKTDDEATISGGKGDVNIGSANIGGSVYGDVIILMDGMKNATVVK
jgi:hypothetical protein